MLLHRAHTRSVLAVILSIVLLSGCLQHAQPSPGQKPIPDTGTSPNLPCSAPCTQQRSLAVILLQDNTKVNVSQSDVKNFLVPELNNYWMNASYHTFGGWQLDHSPPPETIPAPADPAPDGQGWCQSDQLHQYINRKSRTDQLVIVIYPDRWCSNGLGDHQNTDGQYVYLTDKFAIHGPLLNTSASAESFYFTTQEAGHSLLGGAHADGLDCAAPTQFSLSCYNTPTINVDCGTVSYTPPAVCKYGDPWDAMGNDYPGRGVGHVGNVGWLFGDAGPNGVELDRLGWMVGNRKQIVTPDTSAVYSLEPLAQFYPTPQNPQALWIPPTSSTPWLEVEYRQGSSASHPSYSQWRDGFLTDWPQVTGGVLLHAVSPRPDSQSLLLDASPNTNNANQPWGCPGGNVGPMSNNAFCDWYDAALMPGKSFTPEGAPYSLTLLTAQDGIARVAITYPATGSSNPTSTATRTATSTATSTVTKTTAPGGTCDGIATFDYTPGDQCTHIAGVLTANELQFTVGDLTPSKRDDGAPQLCALVTATNTAANTSFLTTFGFYLETASPGPGTQIDRNGVSVNLQTAIGGTLDEVGYLEAGVTKSGTACFSVVTTAPGQQVLIIYTPAAQGRTIWVK